MADPRIEIKIIADGAQAKAELTQLDSKTGKVGTTGKSAFGGLASAINPATIAAGAATAAIAGIVMAVGDAIETFKQFDKRMKNVESLGVTNIDHLHDEILRLATDEGIPTGINDLAEGLYQVVSAGVDAANQIDVLEATAKAGVAGLASTTDALNLNSAVIKGYGKDWSETDHVLDLAFQTVKDGQTTFGELSSSIGKTVPLANTLNIAAEDLFGSFATLTGVTGNTSEVATQLQGVMQAIVKPTDELTQLTKDWGYSSAEAAVQTMGLVPFVKRLGDETGGSADKLGTYIRRAEAMNAVIALSGPQYDTWTKKIDNQKNAHGAAADAYEIQAQSYEAAGKRMDNAVDAAGVAFSKTLEPALVGAQDAMTEFINAIDWEAFGNAVATSIDIIGYALGALGAVLSGTIVQYVGKHLADTGEQAEESGGKIEGALDGVTESANRAAAAISSINVDDIIMTTEPPELEDEDLDELEDEIIARGQAAIDEYERMLAEELDLLRLYRETELVDEETYNTERAALLDEAFAYFAEKEGEKSAIALKYLAMRKKMNLDDLKNTQQTEMGKAAAMAATVSQAANMVSRTTAMFAQQSRTAFEIHKAVSIVEATISGVKAAINSYNWASSWGGPPAGAVAAALAGVQTAMMVNQIAAQEYNPPSFATGGRVDSPMMAMVGDAKRAGSVSDTEYILNTEQMQSVVNNQPVMDMTALKNAIVEAIDELDAQIMFELRGQDLYGAIRLYAREQGKVIQLSGSNLKAMGV
jgi:TP901 family phage tail tape measure protein